MNIKKLTQKDRYGNMVSFEFDVPPMESIPHPGMPIGTDTVPAWLTPGERVMNAEAERMYGPVLKQMNDDGRALQRAQGGTIPEYAACGSKVKYKYQGGPVYAADGIPVTQGEGFIPFDQMPGFAHIRSPEAEGFRPDVYDDPIKGSAVPTVGYGHKLLPEEIEAVRKGKKYTQEELEQLYLQDYLRAQQDARENIPGFNEMTPEMQGAFTSQAFQLGGQGQADFDQMIAAIEAGDKGKAIQEVYNSDWAKQTPKRAEYLAKAIQEGSLQQAKSAVEGEMLAGISKEPIDSTIRLESAEDYANFYSNQLRAGRGNRETYENALVSQFGITPGQAQALITSQYAGEGLVKGLKSPDKVLSEIASGNIAGSDLARVGDPLPRVDVPPVDGTQIPPKVDAEAPPKPLAGLEGVGIEQPEDDRGQAYGDGLKVQLGAVEQQLINLQEEAKDPRKAAELISSITELRDQRDRLADMYDEWAATQGTKQALGYGTEQAIPNYTQQDIELQSPRGTLEERRDRQLITKDVPKPVEVPEPIAQGLEQTETGKQIKKETSIPDEKSNIATKIIEDNKDEPNPYQFGDQDDDSKEAIAFNVQQKGEQEKDNNPSAFSGIMNWLTENLGDLFDPKELARMGVMYLGSRALGYSHGGSLNFAAKNYITRVDQKATTAAASQAKRAEKVVQMVADGKISPKAAEMYKRTGNLAYLDSGLSRGVPKGEYQRFFKGGKMYKAQKVELPNGAVVFQTDDGKQIDGSYSQDAAFHKGTPEYNERRNSSHTKNKASFEEAFDLAGGKDDDTNDWKVNLKVGPEKAAREYWAWAESTGRDADSDESRTIMANAYQQALQDAKEGKVIVPSLVPYLESQHFRETTGTTDNWVLNPEEVAKGKALPKYVRQDKMQDLFDSADVLARKKMPSTSLTVARKKIFDQAINAWSELSDAERQSWKDSSEPEAGVTGYYLYLQDQLNQAYANLQ